MVNQSNIKNSFRTVKGDIVRIQGELLEIKEQQIRILVELEKLAKISQEKKQIKNTKKR